MSRSNGEVRLALVGFGAIGQALATQLRGMPRVELSQIIVPETALARTQALCADLAPGARVLNALDLNLDRPPTLVAECAGHAAVVQHVLPALQSGLPCVVASIGALHDAALLSHLEVAALAGKSHVKLIAGAIGAIDALTAASVGGLDEVTYIGRKPPLSWIGTPAESVCDLAHLQHARVIFRGSAREAAALYPKNANVAATVALAGLGMEQTRVELVADPQVTRNVHRVVAKGAFGRLEMQLENLPLQTNPKTSALTVYSLVRAVANAIAPITF